MYANFDPSCRSHSKNEPIIFKHETNRVGKKRVKSATSFFLEGGKNRLGGRTQETGKQKSDAGGVRKYPNRNRKGGIKIWGEPTD